MIRQRQRGIMVLLGIGACYCGVLGIPFSTPSVNAVVRGAATTAAVCSVVALAEDNCFRLTCRVLLLSHSLAVFAGFAVAFSSLLVFASALILEALFQVMTVDLLLEGQFRTWHGALTVACAVAGRWTGTGWNNDEVRLSSESATNATRNDAGTDEEYTWTTQVFTLVSCFVVGLFVVGRIPDEDLWWWGPRRKVHHLPADSWLTSVAPACDSGSTLVDVDTTDSESSDAQPVAPELNSMSISQLRHLAASMRYDNNELSTILAAGTQRQQLQCILGQIREGRHHLCFMSLPGLYKVAASACAKHDVSFDYNETIDPQRFLLRRILRGRQLTDSMGPYGAVLAPSAPTSPGKRADVDCMHLACGMPGFFDLPPGSDHSGDVNVETSVDDDSGILTAWRARRRLQSCRDRRASDMSLSQLTNLPPIQDRPAEESEQALDDDDQFGIFRPWKLWIRLRGSSGCRNSDSSSCTSRQPCGLDSRTQVIACVGPAAHAVGKLPLSGRPLCQDDARDIEGQSVEGYDGDSVSGWESVHTSGTAEYANIFGKASPWCWKRSSDTSPARWT